jgi:hypothetical protein
MNPISILLNAIFNRSANVSRGKVIEMQEVEGVWVMKS